MSGLGLYVVYAGAALVAYTYAGYPLLLRLLAFLQPRRAMPAEPQEWPTISITVPVYNEEAQIRAALEGLLRLDYPAEKRQILVVSDASTDATDAIVADFADRGVELLRTPRRAGKTAAENAARFHLRGEIVVNTDASVRLRPDAAKALARSFADPDVGLASGCDVSIGPGRQQGGDVEGGYVGYEMLVRDLESRVSGIVGASGCLYAVRAELHRTPVPEHLSRDFMAALAARALGYRAVSVRDAICFVPRTSSLRAEYRRKVRTMTRGIQTLLFNRRLLDPVRYGTLALMLVSHKICRWLVPWFGLAALAGLVILAPEANWARWALLAAAAGLILAACGWFWPQHRAAPAPVALAAAAVFGNLAACHAALRAILGQGAPVWEPTRREAVEPLSRPT